jgi:hypothetical protein
MLSFLRFGRFMSLMTTYFYCFFLNNNPCEPRVRPGYIGVHVYTFSFQKYLRHVSYLV